MSKNIFIIILLLLSIINYISTQNKEEINDKENIEEEENKDNNDTYYDDDKEYNDYINSFNYTNVIYYDDTNYTSILNDSNPTFIIFYTQTCHYCFKYLPTFIETADYCHEKKIQANFIRIDADKSPNATEELNVEEYPSIFFAYKDEKYRYEGMVSKEDMLNFMEKKKNDDVYIIKKLKDVNKYLDKKNLVLMSTIKNKTSELYQAFIDYARSTMSVEFISCLTDECLKKYGEDIILFKKFDEKENSYLKDYAIVEPEIFFSSVYNFVTIFGMETGCFLGRPEIDALFNYGKNALIYVRLTEKDEKKEKDNNDNNDNIPKKDKYDPLFKQLGKEFRFNNTYVFVSDMGETTGTNIGDAFSILPEELPGIFYYHQNTGDPLANVKIYSKRNLDMNKVNKEFILNFINEIKEGKIKRDLYSEPPSDSKMEDGIRHIVGKTYDKYVINEKKNVFLAVIEDEEYMEEEQNFLNLLKKMAKNYENKNIIFAYINISKNEPRDLEIRSQTYPFGFLFTNSLGEKNKSIIKFEPKDFKDISEKEVVNFLEKYIDIKKDYKNEDL